MLHKLKPKSEFARNVLTLMTGTTIAQAIPIAISPVLTRIYTPKNFGVFALYMSMVSIISIVATGRYELAVMLPKKDEDAINISMLSILISISISIITLLLIFMFNNKIVLLLGNEDISNWLYFIPVSVLLVGCYQSFAYWNNRKKYYKKLAISKIAQSMTTAISDIGMGYGGFANGGLIVSGILGQLISVFLLGKTTLSKNYRLLSKVNIIRMSDMAKKYMRFPGYLIVAHEMNTISAQAPVVLFSNLYSMSDVGFYILIQKVVNLPMSIIAQSIANVFRQIATEEYINNGKCHDIFMNTFKKLLFISLAPFLVFYFFAPELFLFVFGKEWRIAGEYAHILTPMFFLQFVTNPLSTMFMIAEKQLLELYWQLFLLISIIISILIGKYVFNSIKTTLILFCVAYSVSYCINFFMTYNFAKGKF